jgi:putative hemolysin
MDKFENVINVHSAIRSSKSVFVRSLPRLIIGLMEKLIHQDEMNETINKFRDKSGVPFINDVLKDWNVDVIVKGSENVPASGRFVFVANHPVGGIDALAFLSMIYRFFPNVISPSNQLFNYIPNLHPVILGVNVFGTNTKSTVEKFNQLFESDAQIMIFPAGLVSRKSKGVISDPEWQKTFITKSIQYKRDIIPVHIGGRNSNLFYFTDRMRKFLRIKLSLEIILLPHEMHNQKNKPIKFSVGKVIPYQTFTNSYTHMQWAQKVKEIVYSIQL